MKSVRFHFLFLSILSFMLRTPAVSASSQFDPYFGSTCNAQTGEREAQILHVTTDTSPGHMNIKLNIDKDNFIHGIKMYSETGEASTYTLPQLETGVLLKQSGNYEVLKLAGKIDNHLGGTLTLIYLSNGMFNSFGKFLMELTYDGANWGLRTNDRSGRNDFQFMFVAGKWFLGQLIGIDRISVSKQKIPLAEDLFNFEFWQ